MKNSVAVQLRTMPKDLHKMLKHAACEDEVSLELFIVSTLVEAMQQRAKKKRADNTIAKAAK